MDTNTPRTRRTGTDGTPSPTISKFKRMNTNVKDGGIVVKSTLPWNVQSFLRQKVYIKDKEELKRIKKATALKKYRKVKTSVYNQETMRAQSVARQRAQRERDLDNSTAYFGHEFRS